MRILVTGAAGFIGSHVVDRLLAAGHHLTGVDNLTRGRLANLKTAEQENGFNFVEHDIGDPSFESILTQCRPEVVCHLAAQIDVRASVEDPVTDLLKNVAATVTLLEAARRTGCKKIVFASSGGSIYGSPDVLPVAESAPIAPESPYAASKAACELYLQVFDVLYGMTWTSLALANVYGPRQDPYGEAGVVAIFGSSLLRERETCIFGDGDSSRDYVYVGDVADAFCLAVHPGAGDKRRFNIGTGKQTTVRELHTLIADLAERADAPTFAESRPGELRASALDARAATAALGWEPRIDLTAGLEQTILWLKNELDLRPN